MNLEPVAYLNQILSLSTALQARLHSILKTREIRKRTFLLKEGQVCNNIHFIEKGLLRIYYLKDDREICSGLLCEGGLAIAVKSFFKRQKSEEYMQALEDTVVHSITYEQLEQLYKDFPEFNIVSRILITEYYVMSEDRNFLLRKKTAHEKFQFFQERFGHLAARVPRKDIASYLGVNLETLCRLEY
jgi:CRP-like cAMP-binding protein